MKNFVYLIAGVSAAVAYFLIKQPQANHRPIKQKRVSASSGPVNELAQELQKAWADHHTSV